MKKVLLVIVLIFMTTGCVNYVELANIEVIENLAVDYENGEYKIAVTAVKKEEEKEYETKYANGKTLTEAIQNLKMKENKKIYIAHLNLLLLTEKVIDNNLEEVIKFFLNNSESRNDFDVAIIKNLDIMDKAQDIKSGIKIVEEDLGTTKSILFEEFFSDIFEEKMTYLPVILDNNKIDGITLIRVHKERIHISKEECIIYNFVDNSIKQTTFKEIPILSSITTYKFKDGQLSISINITTSVKDRNIEDKLENAIEKMYDKYKNKNIDIFNVEDKICNKNSNYCKKHNGSLLKDIKLNVNVKLENQDINDMEVSFK